MKSVSCSTECGRPCRSCWPIWSASVKSRVTYQPNLEQLLVLAPSAVEVVQGAGLTNRNTKQAYKGAFLSFKLNLNLPPPCLTGYLPPNQARTPASEDYPSRPTGDLYCRVAQDSMFNVRGMRNLPCETRPGKRAPTVKMCESDETYIPLNDGYNGKGDPNATLSGQPIPQLPPGTPPPDAPPPAATPAAVVGRCGRIRLCHRRLRRSRWAPVHAIQSGQRRREQPNVAGHAAATARRLGFRSENRHR